LWDVQLVGPLMGDNCFVADSGGSIGYREQRFWGIYYI
jgi:hypothetical protein